MSPEQLILNWWLKKPGFEKTGDPLTDMVLSAFAGVPYSGYNGEILPESPERAWAHAVLSNTDLPQIDYKTNGYELTHLVFYATDFGRKKKLDLKAQSCILELVKSEIKAELLCEYGMAMLSVGGLLNDKMKAAVDIPPVDDHHDIVVKIYKAMMNG